MRLTRIITFHENLLLRANSGARTRDNRHHKPVLFQLSYARHALHAMHTLTVSLLVLSCNLPRQDRMMTPGG